MILLDTNVISEFMRPEPRKGVVAWFDARPASAFYLCTPVIAEIHAGVMCLPPSRRREDLTNDFRRIESDLFDSRVLAFDRDCARAYGDIVARRKGLGRPISVIDAEIAAIARTFGLTLATRNTRDFEALDLDLVDPFVEAGRATDRI